MQGLSIVYETIRYLAIGTMVLIPKAKALTYRALVLSFDDRSRQRAVSDDTLGEFFMTHMVEW